MGECCRRRRLLGKSPGAPEVTREAEETQDPVRSSAGKQPGEPGPRLPWHTGRWAHYLDFAIAVVHHSFPGCHLWFGMQQSYIKLILENLRCRDGVGRSQVSEKHPCPSF